MNVAIYLRKSRADLEAEKNGEFETLKRHKSSLLKLAKKEKYNIIEIKEELVSGESIIHRPRMIELLQEVENEKYDAVLVMDIDRLGRGGMKDQGVILETFKNSNTKIITPQKIYDLENDLDEQYTELESFIARQELKMIKKRLERGRKKSIEEGKFIFGTAPIGYDIAKNDKKEKTLIKNDKAYIIKLIYDLYINEDMGIYKIANHLNNKGLSPIKIDKWTPSTINRIIQNKAYCGYIMYSKIINTKKYNENGNEIRVKNSDENVLCYEGKHEPIIDIETWEKAQKIRENRIKSLHFGGRHALQNPFAGILKCKTCNHAMQRKVKDEDRTYLWCKHSCGNLSIRISYLEKLLLEFLEDTLNNYQVMVRKEDIKNKTVDDKKILDEKLIKKLKSELNELEKQKTNLFNFLERGIYDEDTFLDRSEYIKDKIEHINKNLKNLNSNLKNYQENDYSKVVLKLRNVLEYYDLAKTPKEKNKLLKSIIDEVYYYKDETHKTDECNLEIKLKVY